MILKYSFANFLQNIGVLRSFAISTGKYRSWSLFLAFRPHTLLKRNSNTVFFPVNIAKFLRTAFFEIPLMAVSEWFSESDLQIIKTFVWHYYEQALSSRYYLWYWITNLEKPCQQTFWFFCEGFILWLFLCCKTELNFFFWERCMCFLQNIHYLQKKCFYMEKKFCIEKFFYWKKLYLQRKILMKMSKNISFEKYIFM